MKVSLAWLQKYFDAPLPTVDAVADALTFHSSEIEEVVSDDVLDVKVLPDRAPYALSHRGIAYEVAAALNSPLSHDPLRSPLPDYTEADDPGLTVSLATPLCTRYMAARITGVRVGPSPAWLSEALENLGQRSINNVVDATNYVLLNIGQPLHAFDAAKIGGSIAVRGARAQEKITTLTGEEFSLPEGTLVIADGETDALLGIAGVKGGKAAEITESTTDIIIESANFDGTAVRKASQALKLWTDASLRFQNKLSPELAAYGMRDVIALILEIAGGSLVGVTDSYPNPEPARSPVTTTVAMVNGLLGTTFSVEDMAGALHRLSLTHGIEGETITVQPPFERRDLSIWQDVAEEIGRVLGYDQVTPTALPAMTQQPDQSVYAGLERIKDLLIERGFVEISTQAFAQEGQITLANPLQQERPWLRASLAANMEDALARGVTVAPRVLGPEPALKLFELGTVFTKEGEHLSLSLGYRQLTGKPSAALLPETVDALMTTFAGMGLERAPDMGTGVVEISLAHADLAAIGTGFMPAVSHLSSYTSFSSYPFALRDIAVWTPEGTMESEVSLLIAKEAGDLLVRLDLFDRFEKEGRTSYAFRLVFQSYEKTLADTDIDPVMERVTVRLNEQEGWDVR